jgi:hypothetical protein
VIPLAIDIVNAMIIPFSQAASYPYDTGHDNYMWVFWLIIAFPLTLILFRYVIRLRRCLRANRGKTVRSDRKRRKELTEWAQSKGLSLTPGFGLAGRYLHLQCLQRGDGSFAFNVMEGIIHNRKVCAFDYYYETATTDKGGNLVVNGRYYLSAVVVETDLQLKPLIIRTEKIVDKIAASAGLHDIDFESVEFNKKFYVKSSDRRWAYDIVNPATMELLLSSCRFNLEFNENYIIAYRNELFSVGYFEEALQLLVGVADNLPKPLFSEKKVERK